jgi:hypothetical protein
MNRRTDTRARGRRRSRLDADLTARANRRRFPEEQEDAVKVAADRCGYSPEAAQRAFQAQFYRDVRQFRKDLSPLRDHLDCRVGDGIEL